jgi:DNA-binding transcriptional LysR family regulator
MVSLRQLRYLESLAETRHFGHAAEACAVSQPALSMQIKELEDELQVSLVERRKSGVELTEQGEEIARRARAILASVRDLLDYAKHQEGVLSGVLKLGAIPSIAPYLLPAALPELQRRFPALNLQLRETVTGNLVHELVTGDLDLILVALPIDDPEVETLYLFDDRFILATKATPRNRRFRHASASMLSQERLLLLEEGLGLLSVVGKDDDAHAQVEMHGLGTHEKWLLQKTEDALAGSDGLSTTTRQPQRPEPLLGDGPPRPVLGDALRSRTRVGLVELGLKHRQRRRVGPTSWPAERRVN